MKRRSLEENYIIYLEQNYRSFITVIIRLEFNTTSTTTLSLLC